MGVVFDFVAKPNKEWFCEIVDDLGWFLGAFRWVLISFPLIFEGFGDFAGFLGPSGPLRVVPLAFVFPALGEGFKEPPSPNPPYISLQAGLIGGGI